MDIDLGRQVPALIALFELAGTAVTLQRGTKVIWPDRHPAHPFARSGYLRRRVPEGSRLSSSSLTHRWREMDSNHRSPVKDQLGKARGCCTMIGRRFLFQ